MSPRPEQHFELEGRTLTGPLGDEYIEIESRVMCATLPKNLEQRSLGDPLTAYLT